MTRDAPAQAGAGAGTAPIWISRLSMSETVCRSTTRPSRKRMIVMPSSVTGSLAGGTVMNSPTWRPDIV